MTRNKDLKRVIRARMKKTGESYTAARAQLTKSAPSSTPTPTPTPTPTVTLAQLAGMSDEKVKAATGCTWEKWVYALDRHGADAMTHREIAKLVKDKYKTPSWWTQTVTVGYERIKGLRARGQQRDGSYQATKSRTFPVSAATLFDAWADADVRRMWLTGQGVTIRSAKAPKALRLQLADGTTVVVGITPKGRGKSAVAIEHTKLASNEAATSVKEFWAERFDALKQLLADGA